MSTRQYLYCDHFSFTIEYLSKQCDDYLYSIENGDFSYVLEIDPEMNVDPEIFLCMILDKLKNQDMKE